MARFLSLEEAASDNKILDPGSRDPYWKKKKSSVVPIGDMGLQLPSLRPRAVSSGSAKEGVLQRARERVT